MSLRERTRHGLGIIEPCLPSPAKAPPPGPGGLHEIKRNGFRILARRDAVGVRLITRNGSDFSRRFPFIGMFRRGRRHRGPRSVQARLREHRVEAPYLALSLGAIPALGEGQKPESTGRQTGG